MTRFQVSKHPPCFSKATLLLRCSASLDRVRLSSVPQRHQYYQSTKTSCAEYSSHLFIRFCRSNYPSPRSLPCGGDVRSGPVPFKPGTIGYFEVGRTQDLPGSWRIHPIPLPRSRTSAGSSALTFTVSRHAVPTIETMRTPALRYISRLNHAASVSAAYASEHALPYPMQGSLPVGWLAFAGRESNPLDSIEKFPLLT